MSNAQRIIDKYMGQTVKDKITGTEGPVCSVAFDLYGCAQVEIHPGVQKDGKPMENRGWYDVNRVDIKSKKPVMPIPDYAYAAKDLGPHGPSDKMRTASR